MGNMRSVKGFGNFTDFLGGMMKARKGTTKNTTPISKKKKANRKKSKAARKARRKGRK